MANVLSGRAVLRPLARGVRPEAESRLAARGAVGRGPTKARSVYAGPDAVLCALENSFTPAEQSLVRMGEHQRLRDTRMFFQYAAEQDFRETVERITGRKVRAFVSGVDVEQDVSSELFYLEPSDGGDFKSLTEGASVSYDAESGDKGPKAVNVRAL